MVITQIPKKRFRLLHHLVVKFCLASGLLLFLAYQSRAQVSPESSDTIIENARKEQKLVWYSTAPRWACDRLLYEFETRYPFIKTELKYGGTTKIELDFEQELKSIQEGKTKTVRADIVHLSDPVAMIQWKKAGHLLYYPSKEYAFYPPAYKDDGYWACARNVTICIAYNSEIIPDTLAPKTWKELVNPDWQKKFMASQPGKKIFIGNPYRYATRMVQYYGLRSHFPKMNGGQDFWQGITRMPFKLEMKDVELSRFFDDPNTPIAISYLGYMFDKYNIKLRRPVRAIWPADGVPIAPCPIAITKDAPHPNAAKLFLDFILSEEGQSLFQVLVGDYSVRTGVKPLPGKVPFAELNTIAIDWEDYMNKRELYVNELGKTFGDSIYTKGPNE